MLDVLLEATGGVGDGWALCGRSDTGVVLGCIGVLDQGRYSAGDRVSKK